MRTILYLPCFDYFNHRQRPQHLLWEISKLGFKVIFCNVTRLNPDFVQLSPTFTLCNNPDALDKYEQYIMWLTHGPYADLLPQFRLSLVVSDFADASVDEFKEYAVYDTIKAQVADVKLAASEVIYLNLSAKYTNCHLIKNGVNPEHFSRSRLEGSIVAEDLARVGLWKPIIGFWGALSPWIDLTLLALAADLRRNFNFVLIGGSNMDISLLPHRENIHYLGPRDYELLPVYARHFDAAIVPFQVKPVTLASDPIKVYEYLTCGLPVISTYLPQLEGTADVKLAHNPNEFVNYLDWAVYSGKEYSAMQNRLSYAADNTWESRAWAVSEILKEALISGGD